MDSGENDVLFDDSEDVEFFDVIGAFVLCAEENEWTYTHRAEEASVSIAVLAEGSLYQVEVSFDESEGLLSLMSIYELSKKPADMLRLLQCVNLCNSEQYLGAYCYIDEFGVISWRAAQSVLGTPGVTTEQAVALLSYAVASMQRAKVAFVSIDTDTDVSPSVNRLTFMTPVVGRA